MKTTRRRQTPEKTDTTQTVTFQFTRHLPSCNNILEGKTLGKDFEPSGSNLGIKQTITYANSKSRIYFNSDTVCVSNLLRTWVTAALLYKNNDTLNLYVYPFLKEKVKRFLFDFVEINRGNFPKSIDHTLSKFKIFLDQYRTILPKCIKLFIPNGEGFTEFKFQKHQRQQYDFSFETGDSESGERSLDAFYGESDFSRDRPYDDTFYGDRKRPSGVSDSSGGRPIQCKGTYIEDTIGEYTNLPGFTTDGDLEKFMETYLTKNPTSTGVVHVVTHSATMKAYLENHAYDKERYPTVIKTNLWSFRTCHQNKATIEFIVGVKIDMKQAEKYEKQAKEIGLSLCGRPGSVKVNVCDNQTRSR